MVTLWYQVVDNIVSQLYPIYCLSTFDKDTAQNAMTNLFLPFFSSFYKLILVIFAGALPREASRTHRLPQVRLSSSLLIFSDHVEITSVYGCDKATHGIVIVHY